VQVDVLRQEAGHVGRVPIKPDPDVHPHKEGGRIGFIRGDTADVNSMVALPPAVLGVDKEPHPTPAASVITRPGTRILAIAGTPVSNFTEIRSTLVAATRSAFESHADRAQVRMRLELPIGDSDRPTEDVTWTLSRADLETLHSLGWESPIPPDFFEPEEILEQSQGANVGARAVDAVVMGLGETKRVMLMTYMTFERLFQGTVKVEHLKGPVGIAHMGTKIADRGMTWLFFFMALISVNLAVVNFLPLPIVDGGQFIFLILEGIRGKPVSVAIQNVATIAGLILIGTVFLIVTFRDVANLFG
jgi:regulator of sigma E protease